MVGLLLNCVLVNRVDGYGACCELHGELIMNSLLVMCISPYSLVVMIFEYKYIYNSISLVTVPV